MNQHPDIPNFAYAEGGVVAPLGFLSSGVSAGLKSGNKRDLALIAADKTCPAAAVFTTNKVAAAPVIVSRRHIERGVARAVVINSGNANACTGAQGQRDALAMADSVAAALGCPPQEVIVSSTGVIGVPLPISKVISAIPEAVEALDSRSGKEAWRVKRDVELSWATPILVKSGGRQELVTAGNKAVIAYDPATGRELWRMKGLESNAVPSPVAGDGVVVVSTGYPAKLAVVTQTGSTRIAIADRYVGGATGTTSPFPTLWKNGAVASATAASPMCFHSAAPAMLCRQVACVCMQPFGCPVLPEV